LWLKDEDCIEVHYKISSENEYNPSRQNPMIGGPSLRGSSSVAKKGD
jgi:hypothetical protein